MLIRPYLPEDEHALIALWRDCGLLRPWNDPRRDIRRKLQVQPELLLVGLIDATIVASVMAGYEGHRGWINYLAVAPTFQCQGLGRRMMAEAERLLGARGCPKINLQVRADNRDVIEFYRRLGYAADEVVSLGKRLLRDPPPSA
ncbi:MAG: GNAT family acetyltransferase [Gammaproteobacteria bacterium]